MSRKKQTLRPSLVAMALGLIGVIGQAVVIVGSNSGARYSGWHLLLAAGFVLCLIVGAIAYARERKAP
jgi:hypothetical protein